MKLLVENKGAVTIDDKNYIAQGLEGKIYGKDNTIYKIFIDPSKAIPVDKIAELQQLNMPTIVRPVNIVRNSRHEYIGYTMDWIKSTEPLVKMFNTSFLNDNSILPETTVKLVEKMKETFQFIHDHKCLVVDGNELNYLVDTKTFETAYFIDVDSYQTEHFPATAYHPMTKDYTSQKYSILTDWYTFGIISFQLFVGIHPYRGKHPDYGKKDLEKRVRDHVSIFNSKVTYPAKVRDFSYIPHDYLEWYKRLFEKGERIPPPMVAGLLNVVPVTVKVINTTNNFLIAMIHEYDKSIREHHYFNGADIVRTENKIYIGKVGYDIPDKNAQVAYTPEKMVPIIVTIENDHLKFIPTNNASIAPTSIKANDFFIHDNTVYAVNGDKFMEVKLEDHFANIIPAVVQGKTWNILPLATKVYRNMMISNVIGKPYLIVPYRNKKDEMSCFYEEIQELKGYRVVDAMRLRNVVAMMLYNDKENRYDVMYVKFASDYQTYSVRIVEDVMQAELNMAINDRGIAVAIYGDDSLEVFGCHKDHTDVKQFIDPDINHNMRLTSRGMEIAFYTGKKLHSLKMK